MRWTPPARPVVLKSQRRFPLTDTGLAERFATQHGENARYCHTWGKWLHWDGTRWKIDDAGAIDQLGKLTVRSLLKEAADESDDDRRKALAKFAAATSPSPAVTRCCGWRGASRQSRFFPTLWTATPGGSIVRTEPSIYGRVSFARTDAMIA